LTLERESARLEDPGAKLLDAVSTRWARYGRLILIALAVLAAIALAAFFMLRARAADEEQAAGKLAEANLFFWQGIYDRSLPMAKQVAEQWPNSPSGIDAHRIAGDDQFWLGRFKEAAAEYRLYLGKKKTGLVANAVRRSLAYALESDHQFKDAAPVYEELVGQLDRESSAEFLYATARCYRQMNQPKEADQQLKRLLDEYGETSYANRARIARAELAAAPR
jgi:type II secretory pathway pseudopilin PulG